MSLAADPHKNVISLSAFRATRSAIADPRYATPVVDIDSWYHQAEITKTAEKFVSERQQ